MNKFRRANADLIAGGIFVLVGCVAGHVALGYRLGSLSRMGPGFFPIGLAVLLFVIGVVIALRSLRNHRSVAWGTWRPVAVVAASLLAFAVVVPRFGFAPAVAVAAFLSMLAVPRKSRVELVLLPALLCLFCSLLFITGIGLSVPLFKW